MLYSAIAINRHGEVAIFKNHEYDQKEDFVRDLIGIGCQVDEQNVREADVFEQLLQYTDYELCG